MFGWLKRKPRRLARSALTVGAAYDAVVRYRAIMEQQGTAILDASKLPLPKAEMKLVLKAAWRAAPNANARDAIEHGYLNLAHFQEGVGDERVDIELPPGLDLARDAVLLDAWLAWSKKIEVDTAQLHEELNKFKRALPPK